MKSTLRLVPGGPSEKKKKKKPQMNSWHACMIENVLIFQKVAFNIQLAVSQSSSAPDTPIPLGKTSAIKE